MMSAAENSALKSNPLLEVLKQDLTLPTPLTGVCVGYELGSWRAAQLAVHLQHWLPHFALTEAERTALKDDPAEQMKRAALAVYTSEKYENRGEVGELLLHIILCQFFDTLPAISKYYYKDSANDTIKGFDAVHVVPADDGLELWLGESKFYASISKAISDAVTELHQHMDTDYLRREFVFITNKIDPLWPHAPKLLSLLDPNTSLDKVFVRACVPVFLTYDSKAVKSFHKMCDEFEASFSKEVTKYHAKFCELLSTIGIPVKVHLILLPMESKQTLAEKFDEGLKLWQALFQLQL
ncbi:MAG: HamA C-terminal domain-containing protein [Armatimonadota bacterium]